MMRHRLWLYLLVLLPIWGCGEEAVPAERVTPAVFGGQVEPWDSIPPDSLYGATAAENLQVTRVDLDLLGIPAGWEGMRIAAVSDLQLGRWDGNPEVAEAALRTAVAQNPDLIVLLGDYLGEGEDTTTLRRVLRPLRGRPALAVLGDRDLRTDSLEAAITRVLGSEGIQVLKNGTVPIVHNGDTALVGGVSAKLMGEPAADQAWVLTTMSSGGRIALLLSHSPTLASRAPEGRVAGALAGHTFCGRVEVPGTPRLSWLNSEGLPGAVVPGVERLYRLDSLVLFVTCGVGYSFIPVRFGAPPEVALITLHRVAETPSAAPDTLELDTLIARFEREDTTTR